MKDRDLFFIIAIPFVFASMLCLILGTLAESKRKKQEIHRLAREMMERESVFAGHAEWRPGTNGEPTFYWKDCP